MEMYKNYKQGKVKRNMGKNIMEHELGRNWERRGSCNRVKETGKLAVGDMESI